MSELSYPHPGRRLDDARRELGNAERNLSVRYRTPDPSARVSCGQAAVRLLGATIAELCAARDALLVEIRQELGGEVYEREDPEDGPAPVRPHDGWGIGTPHRRARWLEENTQDLRGRGGQW